MASDQFTVSFEEKKYQIDEESDCSRRDGPGECLYDVELGTTTAKMDARAAGAFQR